MLFGIIGRTGPGMMQVVEFADRSTEGVLLGVHLGHAIVSNGDFTAYMCDNASTVGAAVWGGACGGIAVLDVGQRSFGGFVLPTVRCFGFVCKNLTTFLFGKHIVGKLDLWPFWRYIRFQDQTLGL